MAGRAGSAPLPITSRAAHLWDALCQAYRVLGFDAVGDEVFRQLVCARIIEPTSKIDSARVLSEAGIAAASYSTINRRLPLYAKGTFRQQLDEVRGTPSWGRRRWCSTTLRRCTSKPMPVMVSGSRDFPERVRREALVDRVEVKDLHGDSVAAGLAAEGSPPRRCQVGGKRP